MIPNIQFTSPEADRKVMLWMSIVFMVPFWLFLTAILVALFMQDTSWDAKQLALATFLAVTVGFLIPFQMVRYLRELRKLREAK